jgi:hypothetical protein
MLLHLVHIPWKVRIIRCNHTCRSIHSLWKSTSCLQEFLLAFLSMTAFTEQVKRRANGRYKKRLYLKIWMTIKKYSPILMTLLIVLSIKVIYTHIRTHTSIYVKKVTTIIVKCRKDLLWMKKKSVIKRTRNVEVCVFIYSSQLQHCICHILRKELEILFVWATY